MGVARAAFEAAKHPRGFHGRFGHGTGSAGADRYRTRLKLAKARSALAKPRGPAYLDTEAFTSKTERTATQVTEGAGHRIAAHWKVSDSDLEALIREDGQWEHFKDYTPEQQRQRFAAGLIQKWNGTSGGPIATSAITHVLDRFGIPHQTADSETRTNKYIRSRPELQRAAASFGDAMYQTTQEWFKQRGITQVHALRASVSPERDKTRPFTSWTLHRGGLRDAGNRTIREENIPVSRVFAIPPTGFGNLDESELVVLPLAPARRSRSVAARAPRKPRTARSLMSKR